MKLTAISRQALASRKERRDLEEQGFRRHETDWEIHRGGLIDQVIVDAKISACGKYVFTRLGPAGSK